MVVYIDQAFLVNSVLDYLLLELCGTVTLCPVRRRRVVLGAVLGGLYGVASLVPGLGFLGSLPWAVVFGGLMCLLAFGPQRGLPRQLGVLLVLGAAFSGLVSLLTAAFSAPGALLGGRVYYPVGLGVLLLTGGVSYALIAWAMTRLRHGGGDVVEVVLCHEGRTLHLSALRDTGNTLRDPLSGCPVLVADWDILAKLAPGAKDLTEPLEALEPLKALHLHPRLIPYKTVGVSQGLLLAVRPQEVYVAGKKETMLLALSPVPIADGGGYQALLGGVSC